jgi:hypothetical protein
VRENRLNFQAVLGKIQVLSNDRDNRDKKGGAKAGLVGEITVIAACC